MKTTTATTKRFVMKSDRFGNMGAVSSVNEIRIRARLQRLNTNENLLFVFEKDGKIIAADTGEVLAKRADIYFDREIEEFVSVDSIMTETDLKLRAIVLNRDLHEYAYDITLKEFMSNRFEIR